MSATRALLVSLVSLVSLGSCDGATTTPTGAAKSGGVGLFRLPDLEGHEVEVSTVAGGRTVLAFWATWCQPCRTELLGLDSLYADLGSRGLMVYAINVDDPSTAAGVGAAVARAAYRFPVLLDPETQILSRYHPRKEIPFYVVLDGDGRVLEEHQGYTPGDMDGLRARLEQALLP